MEDESKHEEERASEASVDNEGSGGLAPKSIFDLRLKYRTRANIDRYLSDFVEVSHVRILIENSQQLIKHTATLSTTTNKPEYRVGVVVLKLTKML